MEQRIHFCNAKDNTKIAYAVTGNGYPVVRAAHYLSHLEFDFESPVWRHWIRELSKHNTYIRYDERGCGLSDWNPSEFTFDSFVSDLETVVDSLGLEKFALLGISQGGPVGIAYAALHPERVSHLIIYGSYALGWAKRPEDPEGITIREAMRKLIEVGWGKDNPAFRQAFTSLFIPEAGPEQMRWWNELQRVSCPPANALKFDSVFANIDVSSLLRKVSVPTLILHARHDSVVPFEQGRLLASQIPKARFVSFEGMNHVLLESEPGWQTFLREFRTFLGTSTHAQGLIQEPNLAQPKEDELLTAKDVLTNINEVSLSKFSVVGNYVRHDPRVRNSLKDLKTKIITGLHTTRRSGTSNYLLWAPPGSGKTFLVQEIARSLENEIRYEELNLARMDMDEFSSRLARISGAGKPCLCFTDEIDSKPAESWPYEILLPTLEPPETTSPSASFVLAGSSTSGIDEMKQRIASRPKGPDLLSRIPNDNEFKIPTLTVADKILVSLSQLRLAGKRIGRPVNEAEKLGLYYISLNPRLSNARQLRQLANSAVERLPAGEDRIKYDHLFSAGDPENKEFWERSESVRQDLTGSFVAITD